MSNWDGVRMQCALLGCEIVTEERFTEAGPGPWYFLKLDDKIIPLGHDEHFAEMLQFAIVRNARAFETPVSHTHPAGDK
jgi:hypothetical protein